MKFQLLLAIISINFTVLVECYYYEDYYEPEYYYQPFRPINRYPYRSIRYFGGTKVSGLEYEKLPPNLKKQVDAVRARSRPPPVPAGHVVVDSGDDTEIIAVEQDIEDSDIGRIREESREEWGKDKRVERNRISKAKVPTPAGAPARTPAGTPGGYPARTSAGTPAGTPGGYPARTSAGTPAGTPGGYPARTAAGTPGGYPGGYPAGTPGGYPAGTPGGYPAGTPGGYPAGTAARQPTATAAVPKKTVPFKDVLEQDLEESRNPFLIYQR